MEYILEYEEFNESTNFPSAHSIDDIVNFIPMFRQTEELGITMEKQRGRIIAVRFTKAKVFYDIVDDYHGHLFNNVDSIKVFPVKSHIKLEEK
jgi:hypothetical protein